MTDEAADARPEWATPEAKAVLDAVYMCERRRQGDVPYEIREALAAYVASLDGAS